LNFSQLPELRVFELSQSVGVAFLDATQSHVTDAIAHLSHIDQSCAQMLNKSNGLTPNCSLQVKG